MGASDVIALAVVASATGWLLWRSLFRAKGACHGCSGAGCGRKPSAPEPLVKLGGARAARR